MLSLEGIHAGYGRISVLNDIHLRVNTGEIVTLIGANGAGKTTTLMTISGIIPCRKGIVRFLNVPIVNKRPDQIVRMGISQVPEGRHIFPYMTVKENLDMGAYPRKDKHQVQDDLDHIFSLFPILAERKNQVGGTLSGGEQQMLAISRALMARPRLLLLDEPSLGLAPLFVRQIMDMIRHINETNQTTILLVEQNANIALKLAHRGYVMENGQIVLHDQCHALLNNEKVKKHIWVCKLILLRF
ncbi:MAG: branched-chain amino acid transport system ATP-binding protein [Candidatus Magnetoglobus multicellularis str. Araruama]|uniref:Branched-chain amino acid transport system ATP-binding protein n=1 Tax=Candidatus Magnetoglobus multicellularis str. Araruama TaxID=890399 RepID=A0A1V1P9H9_9BACT|nr:MAG: branched-chain amino acid transport system ATP-binding protein [Candidatus Magnetoglobus multicellularis str. Araruama]